MFELYLFFIVVNVYLYNGQEFCYKNDVSCKGNKNRYLFYDINFPEGFNLRRDVYMRYAILTHKMRNSKNPLLNQFNLILPPWSHMVHWEHSHNPEHIPWGLYFDLENLKLFAPVIEMHNFFDEYPKKYSNVIIDEVYTLQHFEDMFESGNFKDQMEIHKCQRNYEHLFFFYSNITATSFKCLSYHGPATKLIELFLNTTAKHILIEHAEVALHEMFGNKLYWEARRSMRFNKDLIKIAAEFRKIYLNSTDENDNTILPENWLNDKPHRNALGGPYIGVHLRRKDFVRNRPNEAPSISIIAQQIERILKSLKLNTVFVATDGTLEEFNQLKNILLKYKILKYEPTKEIKTKYKDGGIAIIDQIICSYARHFIGTYESTFSFRIQEEREILGFPTESTFNAFCHKVNVKCQKPSVWKIVY